MEDEDEDEEVETGVPMMLSMLKPGLDVVAVVDAAIVELAAEAEAEAEIEVDEPDDVKVDEEAAG